MSNALPTIGVEVATDRARVVVVRGATILWARTAAWSGGATGPVPTPPQEASRIDGPADAVESQAILAQLLENAGSAARAAAGPLARIARRTPDVHVALSPAFARVKRLGGLPPVADDAVLAAAVRENVGQFFLRNAVPLLTGGVRRVPGDTSAELGTRAWAAAYVSPVVCDVIRTCLAARLRLGSVTAAAVVLGRAACRPDVEWTEPAFGFAAVYTDGVLAELRRTRAADDADARVDAWHPGLAAIGPDGWHYAAAFGAVLDGGRDPLSLVPRRGGMRQLAAACAPPSRRPSPPVPRARLLAAGLACAIGLGAAGAAPGLAAQRAERHAAAELRALGPARARVAAVDATLARARAVLDAVAPFASHRRSTVVFLARLARDLPPGAAVVEVRVDSTGGTLVALAPRAGDVVRAVERLPDVAGAEVVGTLAREPSPAEPSSPPSFPSSPPLPVAATVVAPAVASPAPFSPPIALAPTTGAVPTPPAQRPAQRADEVERVTVRFHFRPAFSAPVTPDRPA